VTVQYFFCTDRVAIGTLTVTVNGAQRHLPVTVPIASRLEHLRLSALRLTITDEALGDTQTHGARLKVEDVERRVGGA
jgi:hypothetical protein